MATYNFTISGDFGGEINSLQFHKEVVNEETITPNLIGINVISEDDNVDINFDSTLSSGEQTTLTELISSHSVISNGEIKASTNTTFSTTLTTYQTRDVMTTKYIIAGDYKIDWFYTFKSEDGYPDIRIIIDDTTIIHTNTNRTSAVSSTIEYDKVGFDIQTLNAGQHTIKLQLKGKKDASTTITKSCLFISAV